MTGTYAALKLLHPSDTLIENFVAANKIPQGHEDNHILHSTIIHSRKSCTVNPKSTDVHHAIPQGYQVFFSDGKLRLVLMLDAPSIINRHNEFKSEHGVDHRHSEFIPHITIAYDIGTFSWWNLPPFKHVLLLGEEYVKAGNDRKIIRRRKWKIPKIHWGIDLNPKNA